MNKNRINYIHYLNPQCSSMGWKMCACTCTYIHVHIYLYMYISLIVIFRQKLVIKSSQSYNKTADKNNEHNLNY